MSRPPSDSLPASPDFTRPPPIFEGTERFFVEDELGRGGFGVVYKVWDARRNATVALKTLARHQPDALYRFKQEFRSLTRLVHENLVTLYDFYADEPAWFFTMELVDGVGFLEYVREGGR